MEINNTDLRIGNYITDETGDIFKVYGIHRNGVSYDDPKKGVEFKWTEDLIGIPLTEELLLKMGFEQVDMADMGMHTFIDINFDLSVNYHNLTKTLWIGEHNTNISTVHGCQNLIYILSGQELTLS